MPNHDRICSNNNVARINFGRRVSHESKANSAGRTNLVQFLGTKCPDADKLPVLREGDTCGQTAVNTIAHSGKTSTQESWRSFCWFESAKELRLLRKRRESGKLWPGRLLLCCDQQLRSFTPNKWVNNCQEGVSHLPR